MEGQKPMTRAIVATEMLSMTKNGIMEFKETPFIGDVRGKSFYFYFYFFIVLQAFKETPFTCDV